MTAINPALSICQPNLGTSPKTVEDNCSTILRPHLHPHVTALSVMLATIDVVSFAFKWIVPVKSFAREIDIP